MYNFTGGKSLKHQVILPRLQCPFYCPCVLPSQQLNYVALEDVCGIVCILHGSDGLLHIFACASPSVRTYLRKRLNRQLHGVIKPAIINIY